MAQVTHFFAGANSGDGFQNLFSEIVDLEDTYDLMVLKGGPGVGKATFCLLYTSPSPRDSTSSRMPSSA